MGRDRYWVTFDDGLSPGSITDRDHAVGVFSALALYIVLDLHGRAAAVPSGRQARSSCRSAPGDRREDSAGGSPSGLLIDQSPSGESLVTTPRDSYSVPCVTEVASEFRTGV